MEKYTELGIYLDYITKTYNLNIVVKDFVGFAKWDYSLSRILLPYSIHKSLFCMYIKNEKELWDRCLICKKKIVKKCMQVGQMFYGMCYGGLEEFVIPILCEDMYVGAVCVGSYCNEEKKAQERLISLSVKYGFDYDTLKEKYHLSVTGKPPEKDFIFNILGIAAGYISSILKPYFADRQVTYDDAVESTSYVLAHAIEYIHSHFSESIYVSDISAICHCSESYINHCFKRNIGVNIRQYINEVRIAEARRQLKNSKDSIASISGKCGFSDSNYFATVFVKNMNMTPTRFRKIYCK